MTINAGSVVSNSVLFMRSMFASGISDPISGSRPTNSKFIATHWPENDAVYPMITVEGKTGNSRGISNYSNTSQIGVDLSVRAWSKNIKERDRLGDMMEYVISSNQSGISAFGLHDFVITASANVDEEGKNQPHSRVLNVSYWTVI